MQDKFWSYYFHLLVTDYKWIIEIVIIFASLLLLHFLLKALLHVLCQKFHIGQGEWKGRLEKIIFSPIRFFLWVLGISWFIDIIAQHYEKPRVITHVSIIRNVLIVSIVAWLVLRWKKQLQQILVKKSQKKTIAIDVVSIELMDKMGTILIIFLAILLILQILGVDVMPLVAFGGIGAAIVGFASKDIFANLVGGLMLHVTRPFVRGDLVEISEHSIYANIEEIGWYVTRMRDLEKRPITIPNSLFSNVHIKNLSRITHRRINEVLGVRYEDFNKLTPLIKEIRSFLKKQVDLDQNLPIQVFMQTFNTYSIDLVVRAYTLSTAYDEYMQLKQQILIDIKIMMEAKGVDIAYPTSVVQIEKSL